MPLDGAFLIESPAALAQALLAITPNRPGLLGTLSLELLRGRAQPLAPSLRAGRDRRQLIPAQRPVLDELGAVDPDRFGDDLLRDLRVAEGAITACVRRDL